MKLVMSPEYRKAFPCVTRWFTTCVNQPQFKAVIGTVELAKEEMTAEGAPAAPKKEKVSSVFAEFALGTVSKKYSSVFAAATTSKECPCCMNIPCFERVKRNVQPNKSILIGPHLFLSQTSLVRSPNPPRRRRRRKRARRKRKRRTMAPGT